MRNETAKDRNGNTGTYACGIWCPVLVHIFGGVLDYILIFHFWPAILVVLGVEILFYTLISPTGNEKYDFGALVILFLLTGFTMCMAGADWLLTNVPENVWIHW